jgi:hypothetical protein
MTRRIRAGVALLIAGAGAVVWAYGMTVLEPLTEPLGPGSRSARGPAVSRAARSRVGSSPQSRRRLAAGWASRCRLGLSLQSARRLVVEWTACAPALGVLRRFHDGQWEVRVLNSLRSARQLAVGVWVVSVRARSARCF